ncbi:coiled-coil domain-containing protein [Helicobacter mesocricetorum]|uniref:hypothetical protein n=1 Tax=Helicobacter mesocricetorum TaxID=87012 RepID=UPI000CF1AA75|nr:hypothetical protein [Helicobacter mesocricetorum]
MDENTTLQDSLNTPEFIRQVEQTLLISQEVHNSFNQLIGKYEDGLIAGEQTRKEAADTLIQVLKIKQEMLEKKEMLLTVLSQAQDKDADLREFVLENKDQINATLEKNQAIKESVESTKKQIFSSQQNVEEVLEALQEHKDFIAEITQLIEENARLKTQILEDINTSVESSKIEFNEYFNTLKAQVDLTSYALKSDLDRINTIMPSIVEPSDELKALMALKDAKEIEITQKQSQRQRLQEELQELSILQPEQNTQEHTQSTQEQSTQEHTQSTQEESTQEHTQSTQEESTQEHTQSTQEESTQEAQAQTQESLES